MYNINIFVISSFVSIVFTIFFIIYSFFASPHRKSIPSFILMSLLVFAMSFSTFLMLISDTYDATTIWPYIQMFTALLFPPALFHFVTNFLGYLHLEGKWYLKSLYYVPGTIIFFLLVLNDGIGTTLTPYGNILDIKHMVYIGMFYLLPFLLSVIFIISLSMHNSLKEKRSITYSIILLIGVSLFLLSTSIVQNLQRAMNFEIPGNSIFIIILYFFISISLVSIQLNVENLTLKTAFKKSSDLLLVTNSKGETISLNSAMDDFLFSDNRERRNTKDIKDILHKKAKDKQKVESFFTSLKEAGLDAYEPVIALDDGGSCKYFQITITPIKDRWERVTAKISMFRDVTEQKVLQERLKEESIRDHLTSAYNRRYFYERLQEEVKKYDRYKNPFSLMILDIDNFKRYNDTYGHLKGDWLLKEAVKACRESIREGIDFIARYGGDEFAVVLTKTKTEEAEKIAKRIISKYSKKQTEDTALSIGICQYGEDKSIEDLINCADSLMYEAKTDKGSSIKTPV